MADVFVSYAREDKARAELIAKALQAEGVDVFWDSEIPPGQTWADYIEAKLAQCKAVIVLWSETSTKSQWVREEARMARDRGKLIPVLLDASQMPFGFGEVQAANLSTWTGAPDHADWSRLAAAVRDALKRPATAPPPPRAAQAHAAASQGYAAHTAAAAAASGTSPWGYIQKCLRLYFSGKGRARRSEYWWFVLFQIGVIIIAVIIDATWNAAIGNSMAPTPLFTGLCALALLAPGLSVAARRFHDVGLSGWLVLALLVLNGLGSASPALYVLSALATLAMLAVALIPGQAHPNKYGPSPKTAT